MPISGQGNGHASSRQPVGRYSDQYCQRTCTLIDAASAAFLGGRLIVGINFLRIYVNNGKLLF